MSLLGSKFLKAGPGFGGSCLQKDILHLVYLCRHYGLEEVAAYWEQVVALNAWQQHRIARLVVIKLFGTVTGKRLAVLGFAFKADTNDTPRSRRLLRRNIPSDPHLPRFAGGRGRAGDRRSLGVCGANYERRWPGAYWRRFQWPST